MLWTGNNNVPIEVTEARSFTTESQNTQSFTEGFPISVELRVFCDSVVK